MTTQFGKTWWGNEWLKALTNIDFANRIPRGAAYARAGRVRELKFTRTGFSARVQGTRPTPYKIKIGIPQFDQDTIDGLVDAIEQQPLLVTMLLSRKLSPDIVKICRRHSVQLFPQSWTDLDMYCSCPDEAVPCKHLAAVIYEISLEIDNNPFLIFQMHGVDLIGELKRHGVKIKAAEIMLPTALDTLLSRKKWRNTKAACPELPSPDFSTIDDIRSSLISPLPQSQPFCSFDFKSNYTAYLQRIAKNAGRLLGGKMVVDYGTIGDPAQSMHLVTNELRLTGTIPYALIAIPPEEVAMAHTSVELLRLFTIFALYLLKNGAIIPQIIHATKGYTIRWLPATLNPEIRELTQTMYKAVPEGIVACRIDKSEMLPVQPGEWLLSALIGYFVRDFIGKSYVNEFTEWFFNGSQLTFDDIGETETPGAIKAYFDSFHIGTPEYQPLILISEGLHYENFLLSLEMEKDGERIPMESFLKLKKYENYRFDSLRNVALLSEWLPAVESFLAKTGEEPSPLSYDEFADFLFNAVPIIKLLQIKVFLPKGIEELTKPHVTIRISEKQESMSQRRLKMENLLEFNWCVSVGGEEITPEEFNKLVNKSGQLVRFRKKYVFVSAADLLKISNALIKNIKLQPTDVLRYALSGEYEDEPVTLTKNVQKLIQELTENSTVAVPKEIKAELRPYQERGFSWMYRNTQLGFGSIIADDMGLGKTLQVLTLLQKLKNDGCFATERVLVVVPTGLIHNWGNEIDRFAPDISYQIYHGPQRNIKNFDSDILLTSYGIVRSDVAILKKRKWAMTVIDEAQNIKNPTTAQTKAVKSIPSSVRVAMSGTPVENRLSEYWSIMDFTNPGYLGKLTDFNREYAQPIQMGGDTTVANRFKKITAPFMKRRLKSDKNIISDLPDKIERNETTLLMPEQAALYSKTVDEAMDIIDDIVGDDPQTLFKKSGLVLQMILALKQICNHPAQFLKNGDIRPELSGKAVVLLDIVAGIVESGEKVLIFTQFKEMGGMLQQMLGERLGRKPLFMHGGSTLKQRKEMVDSFQNDRTCSVFILSIKAAGVGLNLTAASNVIHYDLWWNPAVEAQATDRAYRIGQHKNVIVRRFITKGTFEEKIDLMIQDKKHLSEITVANGENWIGNLSNNELHQIFDPEFTKL